MPDDNAKALHLRGLKMFDKTSLLRAFWQETAYNFYVERADFTVERVWGEELGAHLFDSAPLLCRRDLGNAISSMLRPRGQPWFRRVVDDPDMMRRPDVARYMEWRTDIMRSLMYERPAAFVQATKEGDHDWVTFGNAVLTCETVVDRSGRKHLLYRDWHLRDCVWAVGLSGQPDTMFRKMKLSARVYAQKFPDATLPKAVQEAAEKDPEQEFEVMHVALPIGDYDWQKKPANLRGMTYASVYYDTATQSLLRERAMQRFRYIVPRWQTISNCPAGVSPAAMCSLSDARGMQVMARVLLEAAEKQIDPPLKATEKAIRGEVNFYAGGITWVDREYDEKTGAALEPIMLNQNAPLDVTLMERAINKMKDAWYLTKLVLPQTGTRTAYEAQQLVEEFIRANIPLFEPIESDYNAALLDETDAELAAHGAYGPPQLIPAVIRDMIMAGESSSAWSNPLQDAIERNKVNQANIALGIMAGAAKLNPDVVHGVDVVEMTRDAIRGAGSPARWLPAPQLVAQSLAGAAQQRQQQAGTGDVVNALNAAGQAADVVNRGAAAAAALRQVTQPSADQQVAYGPT